MGRGTVRGFQLHVTDRRTFKPYHTTLALLGVIRELYPQQFAWRQPPYEYETVRLPLTSSPAMT